MTAESGATAVHAGAVRSGVEPSAIRKVSIRLVPFVALMFFINYLDRTAIGFAGPNGMTQDLGLTAAQFGFASGIFFAGYIILEVPSNMALHRFGARKWLARIMVSWGIVAVLFTWVQNYSQLAWLRFALGVMEAGFFPGAILFLSLWVPARYRSRILGLFYLAQPLTTVIGAPLAGWLIRQHGLFGLEGWRVMFLGVGIPAVVVGVLAWFVLVDDPQKAKWLTTEEKDWLTGELAAENARGDAGQHKSHGLAAAFRSGRVWILALIYFGFVYGLYALAFFLPTIISGFESQFGIKLDTMGKAWITAIPYVPAAIVLYLVTTRAARRGVKPANIVVPAFIGGLSIPLALYAGSPFLTVAIITVTACAIFSALPVFWTVPTQFLTGMAAAAGIALINTFGNVAGFAAPYVTGWLKDSTGGYQVPMFLVGGLMLLSGVLMLLLTRMGRVTTAEGTDAPATPAGH
ncbi:MFS transporter [Enemella evansiae]|uniref:MFS transporter n=1 Tax=Enemella evansiae TaxID=2016499 RepID=UPI000B979A76|nr:MFS transporter [Enemella evansiae]OYN96946.1 MFS transporter [Enemella evansiae]OYO06212.1 MFS transporter [Enemella evansiae]OYO11900.1 MFS transporter [Enemella evansiae]PFG68944.1 sugar phosphate permease [Propionibacteriaceae bacterium ES.041]